MIIFVAYRYSSSPEPASVARLGAVAVLGVILASRREEQQAEIRLEGHAVDLAEP